MIFFLVCLFLLQSKDEPHLKVNAASCRAGVGWKES